MTVLLKNLSFQPPVSSVGLSPYIRHVKREEIVGILPHRQAKIDRHKETKMKVLKRLCCKIRGVV